MKLNLEQSKHLAGTSRIVSVGLFGLYGYPYLLDKGGSLGLLFVAILLSLTLEVISISFLMENENE